MNASSPKTDKDMCRMLSFGERLGVETTRNQSGFEREMHFFTRAIVCSRACVMVRNQAEGEIVSFEPDASELTGAGADATEVGKNVPGCIPRAFRMFLLIQRHVSHSKTEVGVGQIRAGTKSRMQLWPRDCAYIHRSKLSSTSCAQVRH